MEVLYSDVNRALFARREGVLRRFVELMTADERKELREQTSQLLDEIIHISVLLKEMEHDGITT